MSFLLGWLAATPSTSHSQVHVRGIWRRCTPEEYKKDSPNWETVLDLDELGYEGSVTKSLMIGGCNSSRCSMVGAVVAAMQGGDTIPAAWIEATNRGAEFVAASERLA